MRNTFSGLVIVGAMGAFFSAAAAETKSLEVTVGYRERIALPPDAELEVQLLDMARSGADQRRIASQRFAVSRMPMTVALTYDPLILGDQADHTVSAEIWADGALVFRTDGRHDAFAGGPVDILLSMVASRNRDLPLPRTIAGVQWAVTEVLGVAWSTDDPATLVIDGDGNFSAFGGCNRFRGQLIPSGGMIAFPQNIAGTLMACRDDVEALERSFLDALISASGYVRYGGGLVMTDAAGNALMHFVERP